MTTPHKNITNAMLALQQGKMIVLSDKHRENEADMVVPAQFITQSYVNMMRLKGSGIICLATTEALLQRLNLPLMVAKSENTSHGGTPFTVSVDAKNNIKSGISVADRVKTILAMIDDHATPDDLVRPGHLFPLQAKNEGVLERAGHTEGAVDLMKLSGLKPAAVICELISQNGSVMQDEAVLHFAKQNGLILLSIEEIIAYRKEKSPKTQSVS